MYTLAVRRDFIGRHFLIGGDWGAENLPHAHHYLLQLELRGKQLDVHGYLVDIVDVSGKLDALVQRYRDQMLNDFPEFEGLNPSLEHFARILALKLDDAVTAANIDGIKVVLWENDSAWAAYAVDRRGGGRRTSQVAG